MDAKKRVFRKISLDKHQKKKRISDVRSKKMGGDLNSGARIGGRYPARALIGGKLVLTGLLAVFLALLVNSLLSENAENRRETSRQMATQTAVGRMNTIAVGMALPDESFLANDSQIIRISSIVDKFGAVAVCFIELWCDACLAEIESVASLDPALQEHFVFISADSPASLNEIRTRTGIRSPLLHDISRRYTTSLAISTFPMMCILNEDGIISEIQVASYTHQEIENIANRMANPGEI